MIDSPRIRPDLAQIPGYRAGRRPPSTLDRIYSLASNETSFEPLPGVLPAICSAAEQSHRYPDPAAAQLTEHLAERAGVAQDWISTGTGSVALCQQAVVATCSPGDEVIFAWRSFEAYPIISALAGARPVRVPLLTDGRHDLAAMARAVTDRTRVAFLCSPNNPTGPTISGPELDRFLAEVPATVLVVVDEAYHEFAVASDLSAEPVDGVAAARERPNVLALRTFSKAYGLAGLRVGYGIANPRITAALRRTALPFGVSSIAQAAAIASLAAEAEMRERVASAVAERDRVVARVRALGWSVPESGGNYYWLPLGEQTDRFAAACLDRGVTVRAFSGEGARVTVAETAANDLVLQVLAGTLAAGAAG